MLRVMDHPFSSASLQLGSEFTTSFLSPHLPFSIVFHLALNLLSNHPQSESQILIILRSKQEFDDAIQSESDGHLITLNSHQLLDRIKFLFCDGLPHLLKALEELSRLHHPLATLIPSILPVPPPAPICAIILAETSSYLSEPRTLSGLTKVLGLISSTHLTPSIIFLDRLDPNQIWPLNLTDGEDEGGGGKVMTVFQHFSHTVWTINLRDSTSQDYLRYGLESLENEEVSCVQKIEYEVFDGDEEGIPDLSAGLRWTRVVVI